MASGVSAFGVLLILFAAYSLWGTGVLAARQQDRLRSDFERRLNETAAAQAAAATSAAAAPAFPQSPSGDAVAMLRIPKIGVDTVVVQGAGFRSLMKGPGHYDRTPLPGEPGNAAIAGHRTTYGAPFRRLDELVAGDPILVTTTHGNFRYVVTETRVVRPSERSVLFATPGAMLTLTTCNPPYRATQRLIVRAALDQSPVQVAAPVAVAPLPSSNGGGPTGGDVLMSLAAAMGAAAVAVAITLLRRRRSQILAWAVLGLPMALALVVLFEHLNRLLPSMA